MKKFFALFLSLMMLFACTAMAETAVDMSAPTFEVGEDTAEYEVEGASGYNVVNAFVKIAAGDDVLFNGTVTLTSDTLTVAEFTLAAIYELGCGQEGLEAGFVTSMGDYVSGTDANGNEVHYKYYVIEDSPSGFSTVITRERILENEVKLMPEFYLTDPAAVDPECEDPAALASRIAELERTLSEKQALLDSLLKDFCCS